MYILILYKKKDDEKGEKDFSKDIIIFHNNACISKLSGLLVCYILAKQSSAKYISYTLFLLDNLSKK